MLTVSSYRIEDRDDLGLASEESYLIVNSAGYFEFNQQWSSRHRVNGRADFMFIYVHSGKMTLRTRTEDVLMEEGSSYLYHPYQEQLYHSIQNYPVKCYWIHFTGYGVTEVLSSLKIENIQLFNSKLNNEVPNLIKRIMDEIQYKNYGYEAIVSALLLQYITSIARGSAIYPPNSLLVNTSGDMEATFKYIHQHFTENIKVSTLSNMSGLCINRYIKVFKEVMGYPPKEYLVRFRLQKACELFNSTNFSVKQVAYLVGFQNQLYFSRMFKKYYNITPTEYRNSI